MRVFSLVLLARAAIAIAVFGTACGRDPGASPAPAATPSAGFDHFFTIRVGSEPVRMRLAVRPHEQSRGLMHVKAMPEDTGMLFVYEAPQRLSFWMRNTYIPLDIGFFDGGGVLREVHAMFPHIEDPVASVSEDLQYALEMNRGWFAAHGIAPGASIDLSALTQAMETRGFDATRYVSIAAP